MDINKARKTLETHSYRNEWAIKSEVFNSKFQNSVKSLDSYGHTMHNKDVIDLLWTKLNNVESIMFVASKRVDYFHNSQKYTKILQKIATGFSTGKTPPFKMAGVLELKTGWNNA